MEACAFSLQGWKLILKSDPAIRISEDGHSYAGLESATAQSPLSVESERWATAEQEGE